MSIARAPALAYHVLQLNASRPQFQDLKVRQAIACAIDRQEVLDTASLGEGEVTSPATPPFYRAPLGDLFCYKKDVDKAKQLLTDAGKSTGLKFKVIAAADEPPTAVAEAQNIQAQLKKVGVEMEIETLELGVYVDRWLKADFDAAVALNGCNPGGSGVECEITDQRGWLRSLAAPCDIGAFELVNLSTVYLPLVRR